MEPDDETPNFRKFSPRSALRTVVYVVLILVAMVSLNGFGLILLLVIREARRYWLRRKLQAVRTQLRGDFEGPEARMRTVERITSSALSQALLWEYAALMLVALILAVFAVWGQLSPWSLSS